MGIVLRLTKMGTISTIIILAFAVQFSEQAPKSKYYSSSTMDYSAWSGMDSGMDSGYDYSSWSGMDSGYDYSSWSGMDSSYDYSSWSGMDSGYDYSSWSGMDSGMDSGYEYM